MIYLKMKNKMVYREKNILVPPANLLANKWNTLKANLLIEMHAHEVNSSCYRDTTLDDLTLLYKNKCAICERDRGYELQVDHYRPKKTRDNINALKYNQPGYYWLAYEWSNLIPLCSKCNGNKSNKFPLIIWDETNRISSHLNVNNINGFNAYDINWLQAYEKPFIVNPELERTPAKHFSFQSDCKMVGRTIEGTETINICKLNGNDLKRERLKIRQKYVNGIKSALDDFAISKNKSELRGELKAIFKTMKANCHEDEPFSLFHVFLYNYFDYFIGSKLPSNLGGIAIRYFNEFK
jgi:5-methylcytosine-specific restriction endonuclease McrA